MLPSVKGFKRTRISMFIWLVFLLPLPFLLSSLGTTFVVLATLLNLGWLYVGLTSLRKRQIKLNGQQNVYLLPKLFSSIFRFSCCYLTDKNDLKYTN